MQEVYHDGTKGEIKQADSLEDLLPDIKAALDKSEVAYVMVFKNATGFKSEEKIDLFKAMIKNGKNKY